MIRHVDSRPRARVLIISNSWPGVLCMLHRKLACRVKLGIYCLLVPYTFCLLLKDFLDSFARTYVRTPSQQYSLVP